MPVRKLIVKAFVREVILDNDSVPITHNFNISTKNLKWHSRACLMKHNFMEVHNRLLRYENSVCTNRTYTLFCLMAFADYF